MNVARTLEKASTYVFKAAAIILSLFALYTGFTGVMLPIIQRGIFLLLVLILIFTKNISKESTKLWRKLFYLVFMVLGSWAVSYHVIFNQEIANSLTGITPLQLFLGICLVLAVVIATKITVGWPMVIISILFVLYALFGKSLPGMLGHRGYSLKRVIEHLCAGTNGLYSTPLGTAATMVIMFIVFGSFLEVTGGAEFFMDLSIALTGRSKGGPAKAAVVSSALMGTISGSPASNVVTTGTFTIPLMKRIGYKNHVAGAVEAVASTGGQIMPPVMGTAAFVMAELTGIPYSQIALAALIPAILYYVSVFFMVHLEAHKYDIPVMSDEDIPDLKKTWKQNWHTLVPVIVVVVALVMGYSAVRSALYGTVAVWIFSSFRKHTRLTPKKIIDALVSSGASLMAVGSACSCAGLIIGSVSLTGLGLKISSLIIAASGGKLIIGLLLTLVTIIILGMGMPTAPAYIMVATLVAPGLVEMGLTTMGAHMFCVYGAALSAITPPVALAAYAAAGIADANPMKIGFSACKFGIVAFIVPFFFAYEPSLLCIGTVSEILLALVTALVGTVALAVAMQGYFKKPVNTLCRVIVGAGALLMMYPGAVSDVIGIVMVIVGMLPQFKKSQNVALDA